MSEHDLLHKPASKPPRSHTEPSSEDNAGRVVETIAGHVMAQSTRQVTGQVTEHATEHVPGQRDGHFDGARFFNPRCYLPGPATRPGVRRRGGIFRWQAGLRPRWPDALPPTPHYPLPDPAPGTSTATFINHATVLLQFGRAGQPPFRILTDPIFSERCSPFRNHGPKRVRPPGHALHALPPIDVILVSHCHYDHLDAPSLRALARRDDPLCISLPGNRRHLARAGLARIAERDWWDSIDIGDARITATPALHNSARSLFDARRALWGGFMIDIPTPDATRLPFRVFFAGDTAWGLHFDAIRKRCGVPDLALLPIGAYDPRSLMHSVHMNPEEAVLAFDALEAKQAIAIHFNTFQLTDEPIGEPAARLATAVRHERAGKNRLFEALDNGESRTLSHDPASR